MSQENVEVVRSILANWGRGDFTDVEWAHPEIEFVIADGLQPGAWTGLADMSDVWAAFLHSWDDFRSDAEEYLALDSVRVLALIQNSGRGKASGLDVGRIHTRGANLFHVRGGKVTRLVLYFDRDRALADLGLSEQDAHADS